MAVDITTCLLFLIGKFAISLYISKSDIGSTYGAAGSLAVIFVWIYYSAIILYFGAEFTKAYALNTGARIVPNHYAEWTAEPTVPNAEPKEPPVHSPSPSENTNRHAPQHAPQLAISQHQTGHPVILHPVNTPKKSPGLGTVLFGLAVYYMDKKMGEK